MRKWALLAGVIAISFFCSSCKQVKETQAKDEAKWNPIAKGALAEPGTKPDASKPCTFLDREDIKAALGTDQVRVFPDGKICGWFGPEASIGIEVFDSQTWEYRKNHPRKIKGSVEGVGDEAFSDGGSVLVRKGEVSFGVDMQKGQTESDTPEKALELATKIASRM